MTKANFEMCKNDGSDASVVRYCMVALIAEDAVHNGNHDFSRVMESALGDLLSTLPRHQQVAALQLSYEIALAAQPASRPQSHLRLAFSRNHQDDDAIKTRNP